MAIKAVLFDLDGVLIDSRDSNRELIKYVANYYGLEQPTIEETNTVYNLTLVEGLMRLFGVSEDAARRMVRDDHGGFDIALHLMRVDPTLPIILNGLQKYRLGIVTGRGMTTYRILHHFGLTEYFPVVVDRTQYERPKPNPESLLIATRRLGVKPYQTTYVGDGDVDLDAANAAGMIPIYLSDTINPKTPYNIRNLNRLDHLLMSLDQDA